MEDDLLRRFLVGHGTHLLEAVCYGCYQTWRFEGEREKVEAWYRRWAPFSREGLLQMLETGTRKERMCALFSLGRLGYAEDRPLVRAYLRSPQVCERWASAIVLWEQRERGLAPVLRELLCDGLQTIEEVWTHPSEEVVEDYGWTGLARLQVLHMLAMGGDPEAIPLLSEALWRCWETERRLDEALIHQYDLQEQLFAWEDTALYGLGQAQVWDPSLAQLPAGRLRVAQVVWTLGALHAHEAVPAIDMLIRCPGLLSALPGYVTGLHKSMISQPTIPEALRAGAPEPTLSMEDVKAALGRFFGLSAEQQEDLLTQFPSDCSIRLRETPDFLRFSKEPPGLFRLPEAELYQMWVKDFSLTGKAYDIRPPRREGEQEEDWEPDSFADE